MSAALELRARSNFFAEGAYLKTDIVRGVTRNRAGTRIVALTSDFLVGFRRALADECGPAAESVMNTFGRKWGALLAKRFDQEMRGHYRVPVSEMEMPLFQGCLAELFARSGFGRLTLDFRRADRGVVVAEIRDPFMAGIVGVSDKPVDAILAGILESFFSHYSGEALGCVQTECQARGDEVSRFVLALKDRLAEAPGWVESGVGHDEILRRLDKIRG